MVFVIKNEHLVVKNELIHHWKQTYHGSAAFEEALN